MPREILLCHTKFHHVSNSLKLWNHKILISPKPYHMYYDKEALFMHSIEFHHKTGHVMEQHGVVCCFFLFHSLCVCVCGTYMLQYALRGFLIEFRLAYAADDFISRLSLSLTTFRLMTVLFSLLAIFNACQRERERGVRQLKCDTGDTARHWCHDARLCFINCVGVEQRSSSSCCPFACPTQSPSSSVLWIEINGID